jgi:hypothetical protein
MILESDCLVVISKLQARDADRSLIAPVIRDVQREASQLESVTFTSIRREQNNIAIVEPIST